MARQVPAVVRSILKQLNLLQEPRDHEMMVGLKIQAREREFVVREGPLEAFRSVFFC